jgi:hypothetical protein
MASSVDRRRRPRRKDFVGGYTSSGKDVSELNLPVVRGPGAGGKRLDLEEPRDKKK